MGAAGRCLLCSLSQGFPSGADGVLPVLLASLASVGTRANIRWRRVAAAPGIDKERNLRGAVMFHRCTMVLGVSCLLLSGVRFVSADVFNMPTGQTSLQFVTVGNPGNAADTRVMTTDGTTGYGAVPYAYQMGEYDVTTAQYCQFLNAVAKTDAYGLYYSGMNTAYSNIKITRNGSSGNYSYSVTGSDPQAANCPVFDVTWGDAARFCNWVQNGQPTGAE